METYSEIHGGLRKVKGRSSDLEALIYSEIANQCRETIHAFRRPLSHVPTRMSLSSPPWPLSLLFWSHRLSSFSLPASYRSPPQPSLSLASLNVSSFGKIRTSGATQIRRTQPPSCRFSTQELYGSAAYQQKCDQVKPTTQNSANTTYSKPATNSRQQGITDARLRMYFLKIGEFDAPQSVKVASLFCPSTCGI